MNPQIKQAKLETLEAIIKEVEGMKIDLVSKAKGDDFVSQIAVKEVQKHEWSYNQALSDLLTKLQAQKELLENEK